MFSGSPRPRDKNSVSAAPASVSCSVAERCTGVQGEVRRLDPGKPRTGGGRTFPMTRELRELLDRQRTMTENLQRQLRVVCPRLFHRSELKAPECVRCVHPPNE